MTAPLLSVRGVTYTYPDRPRPTLDGVTFDVAAGGWTTLVGATGSGKSTLLKLIAGLIGPDAAGRLDGEITVAGAPIASLSRGEMAARVGWVGQAADDQICSTNVAAEIAFGLENLGVPAEEIERRIADVLTEFELASLADESTQRLSGGEKQRLVLAAVMVMRPHLLLLDEPLAQLDPAAAAELLEMLARLQQAGTAIVVAEHRVDQVANRADQVYQLRDGKLERVAATTVAGHELSSDDQCETSVPVRLPAERFDIDNTQAGSDWTLHAEGLAFAYPGAAPVWQGVSFTLTSGESVAVLGPNGSGKSTLLGVLTDLHAATQGAVTMRMGAHGDELARTDELVRGLLLQNPDLMLFARRVADELAFGPRCAGCDAAEVSRRVADVAGMFHVADLLDEDPLALSQGQRLRVALAGIVALGPQLLALDEPTTGQDAEQIERLMTVLADRNGLRREGRCLVFSTHDVQLAGRFADRVLVLARGR
ncbi:MAG: ABC transporter ATP-binding protein, partial [Planctomycetales bacterium]|nr:ABC transporter ATP-binding protein [Planctomycetales bacterium]